MAQSKLVSVIQGKVIDFVINLDKDSDDFGKLETFILTSGEAVYVPKGYAHGFLTLQSGTIVNYLVDNEYSKEHEGCIQWDTVEEVKDIITKYMRGFNFKIKISDKDTEGITLEDYKNK
jgi:dTDP-4-dehydrorhamnose 3,5-epimerase